VNIRLENYTKRTPDRWKRIGDFFLYSIPVVNGVMMTMPEVEHGAAVKAWVLFGWNLIASLIKIATKYLADDAGEIKAIDKQPQI
jgi:uncharacterized protein (DUF697 family)